MRHTSLALALAAALIAAVLAPAAAVSAAPADPLSDAAPATVVAVAGDSTSTFAASWVKPLTEIGDTRFVLSGGYAGPGKTSTQILSHVAATVADVLVIRVGTNDMTAGTPIAAVLANIEAIAAKVGVPRVILAATVPSDHVDYGVNHLDRRLLGAQLNVAIEALATARGWDYIDPSVSFRLADNGYLAGATLDSTHPLAPQYTSEATVFRQAILAQRAAILHPVDVGPVVGLPTTEPTTGPTTGPTDDAVVVPSPPAATVTVALAGDATIAAKGSWVSTLRAANDPGVVFQGGYTKATATSATVLRYIKPSTADILVIRVGSNDVKAATPAAKIAANVAAIAVKSGVRNIVIAATVPSNITDWGTKRYDLQARGVKVNAALKALAAKRGWTYLDPDTAFRAQTNRYKKGASRDGVLPTAASYVKESVLFGRAIQSQRSAILAAATD